MSLGSGVHSPASVVRTWARLATATLARERQGLNQINVFPVADADTGTNLHLTIREGAAAVAALDVYAGAAALTSAFARGAMLGARGNSGVIISEWLRGLAEASTAGQGFDVALATGARFARAAVAEPAAGTILTAADAAAAAVSALLSEQDGRRSGALSADDLLDAAVAGARQATANSINQMDRLAQAGVLDAGACGFVLILEALRVASEFERSRAEAPDPIGAAILGAAAFEPASAPAATYDDLSDLSVTLGLTPLGHERVEPGFGDPLDDDLADDAEFEVMFVVRRREGVAGDSAADPAAELREALAAVGDSVVVVGGGSGLDAAWQAHVHTADLEGALEVAGEFARRLEVEPVQIRHLATAHGVAPGDDDLLVVAQTRDVAVAAELAAATAVVLFPMGSEPPTGQILAGVALGVAPAGSLVLTPDPAAVLSAAVSLQATYRLEGVEDVELNLTAIESHSDLEAVVAVAALAETAGDPQCDRTATVQAILEGLQTISGSAAEVTAEMRARTLSLDCLITILHGTGVSPSDLRALTDLITAAGAEYQTFATDQPGDQVDLGIEAGTVLTTEDLPWRPL